MRTLQRWELQEAGGKVVEVLRVLLRARLHRSSPALHAAFVLRLRDEEERLKDLCRHGRKTVLEMVVSSIETMIAKGDGWISAAAAAHEMLPRLLPQFVKPAGPFDSLLLDLDIGASLHLGELSAAEAASPAARQLVSERFPLVVRNNSEPAADVIAWKVVRAALDFYDVDPRAWLSGIVKSRKRGAA
jgi:hypothetical protein